jgi:hypothetical protein
MYKLSEDISKSAFFYEFTKKIVGKSSNLSRYRSKEAIYSSETPTLYQNYLAMTADVTGGKPIAV